MSLVSSFIHPCAETKMLSSHRNHKLAPTNGFHIPGRIHLCVNDSVNWLDN